MDDIRNVLLAKIAESERETARYVAALKALDKGRDGSEESGPYSSLTPIDAMRIVLDEVGHPMAQEELEKRIVEGGVRSKAINTSFTISVTTGKLKRIRDLIGRGEWDESRWQ